MTNTIPQVENEPLQLDRLAAARQMYSDAKQLQVWQILISVFAVIVWSVVVLLFPQLKIYAAVWGGLAGFVDFMFLARRQKQLKKQAALVQELFDTEVLQLDWKSSPTRQRPVHEEVIRYSDKYKLVNRKKPAMIAQLRNWYSVNVERLPLYLGRLACQRYNCKWDGDLRRRFASITLVVVILVPLVLGVIGLLLNFTLEAFLFHLFTFLPALIFGVRQYRENIEEADTVDRLRDHAKSLWDQALSGKLSEPEVTLASRNLQDDIYDHRRTSPLVPDWVFRRFRNRQENEMNRGIEALVDEAEKALGLGNVTP